MTFKKQHKTQDFHNALSPEWQKTRVIAEKVGCTNDHVTKTLLSMPDDVEWRWTTGGKTGTREWKLKESENNGSH